MVYFLLGPIVTTIIAFIVDLIFMANDVVEDAKKLISNSLSTLIPLGLAAFFSFNVDFILNLQQLQGIQFLNEYAIRAGLVLVLAIIIHAKSAAFKSGPGSHEKWFHTLIVAAIVATGPYMWPFIQPFMPF